jgi:hypothetical protein
MRKQQSQFPLELNLNASYLVPESFISENENIGTMENSSVNNSGKECFTVFKEFQFLISAIVNSEAGFVILLVCLECPYQTTSVY